MKLFQQIEFDLRAATLLVLVNVIIVLLINIDSSDRGLSAGVVQIPLSFLMVGYVMPKIRHAAQSVSKTYAYMYGAIGLPTAAMLFSWSVHYWFATPNFFETALYLFFATLVVCALFVYVKRHALSMPTEFARQIARRL